MIRAAVTLYTIGMPPNGKLLRFGGICAAMEAYCLECVIYDGHGEKQYGYGIFAGENNFRFFCEYSCTGIFHML